MLEFCSFVFFWRGFYNPFIYFISLGFESFDKSLVLIVSLYDHSTHLSLFPSTPPNAMLQFFLFFFYPLVNEDGHGLVEVFLVFCSGHLWFWIIFVRLDFHFL
jgi:hypothetical protein